MPIDINDFHFLRPYLLWLLIPALLLIYRLSHQAKKQSAWQNVISPHLLKFLFVSNDQQKLRSTYWLTSIVLLLIIVAISGPSFRQKSVPVFETEHAQVILLDLSLSMDATDIKPSRIERAKFKLLDLLKTINEGTVALVIYAGDAFTISPLTSDANTIASMIPTLSTGIMPVLGSRPDIAIAKSIELLKNAKHTSGEIIWLTDGVESEYVDDIIATTIASPYQLSILAIGTPQGAPIPLPDGNGFLKDNNGAIVVPKLEASQLKTIASETNAGYVEFTADDSDIQYLQKHQQWQAEENENENNNEQMINRWVDDGYWLIWVALVLFLLKLLRQPSNQIIGYFAPLLSIGLLSFITTPSAQALEWQDLWATKNQQATKAYQNGEYDKAAGLYKNPEWQATSQYKNGDFAEAANNFDPESSSSALYNHATSLAKAQQLQPALDAYNRLLEKHPEHKDGLFNKKIIEDMLKQQQQNQNNEQDNQDQESDQENKDQQSEDSKSDSEEEKQGEENSEQQDQEQQESEEEKQQQQKDQEESEKEAQQKQMEMSKDERDKSEKDQALEHWLEKIPDDPGGLLRRKMYREYQRRGREQKEKKLW